MGSISTIKPIKPSPFLILTGLLLSTLLFSHGYCEKSPADYSLGLSDRDNRILEEVSRHMGVPYKSGGSSKSGVDCSGFVRLIYRHIFNVDLPYVAASQSRLPIFDDITFEELRTGDLIYFTRTPKKVRINHVGIYLKDGKFAHAIEKKGVIVSNLSERHWKTRVKKIKRITKDPGQ